MASKDWLKLGSGVEALDGKLQVSVPQVGKVFNAPALSKASRKGFGNCQQGYRKASQQKLPTSTVKKVSVGHEDSAHASALKITEKPATAQSSVPAPDDTTQK